MRPYKEFGQEEFEEDQEDPEPSIVKYLKSKILPKENKPSFFQYKTNVLATPLEKRLNIDNLTEEQQKEKEKEEEKTKKASKQQEIRKKVKTIGKIGAIVGGVITIPIAAYIIAAGLFHEITGKTTKWNKPALHFIAGRDPFSSKSDKELLIEEGIKEEAVLEFAVEDVLYLKNKGVNEENIPTLLERTIDEIKQLEKDFTLEEQLKLKNIPYKRIQDSLKETKEQAIKNKLKYIEHRYSTNLIKQMKAEQEKPNSVYILDQNTIEDIIKDIHSNIIKSVLKSNSKIKLDNILELGNFAKINKYFYTKEFNYLIQNHFNTNQLTLNDVLNLLEDRENNPETYNNIKEYLIKKPELKLDKIEKLREKKVKVDFYQDYQKMLDDLKKIDEKGAAIAEEKMNLPELKKYFKDLIAVFQEHNKEYEKYARITGRDKNDLENSYPLKEFFIDLIKKGHADIVKVIEENITIDKESEIKSHDFQRKNNIIYQKEKAYSTLPMDCLYKKEELKDLTKFFKGYSQYIYRYLRSYKPAVFDSLENNKENIKEMLEFLHKRSEKGSYLYDPETASINLPLHLIKENKKDLKQIVERHGSSSYGIFSLLNGKMLYYSNKEPAWELPKKTSLKLYKENQDLFDTIQKYNIGPNRAAKTYFGVPVNLIKKDCSRELKELVEILKHDTYKAFNWLSDKMVDSDFDKEEMDLVLYVGKCAKEGKKINPGPEGAAVDQIESAFMNLATTNKFYRKKYKNALKRIANKDKSGVGNALSYLNVGNKIDIGKRIKQLLR